MTNRDDLIERLHKVADDWSGIIDDDSISTVLDAINYLSTPLPDDVVDKVMWLRQEAYRISELTTVPPKETSEWKIANMLERLQRDRDNFEIQWGIVESDRQELQQRIAELEAQIEEYDKGLFLVGQWAEDAAEGDAPVSWDCDSVCSMARGYLTRIRAMREGE